jgi:hypothetical protein
VPLGCDVSDAAGPELGRAKKKNGRGKGAAGRTRLSFQLHFGPLPNRNYKILFVFKSFYNLQTNLNSIQIRISKTSAHTIKDKNTSQLKGKYASA